MTTDDDIFDGLELGPDPETEAVICDELTDAEAAMLDGFRRLTPHQQRAVVELIATALANDQPQPDDQGDMPADMGG